MSDYSGSHFREQYMLNMYKHIEKCGRTCYKSEDKITEDSAERFVKGLIKSGHLSVLEHGVIYLCIPERAEPDEFGRVSSICEHKGDYKNNPYSKECFQHWEQTPNESQKEWCLSITRSRYMVTTNYRVIIENGWEDDLQYLCEPTEYHEKRHTVLLHTCIHTYKDLTRHRKMSFSIESTRYCNYSKTDKFGEMKFVLPPWVNLNPGSYHWHSFNNYSDEMWCGWRMKGELYDIPENSEEAKIIDERRIKYHAFLRGLEECERDYNELIISGWQPQQAAEILPQCTAADVIMSGFESDWDFVFQLRSDIAKTGKPHPLVEEIMTPLRDEFKKRKDGCKAKENSGRNSLHMQEL